MNNIALAFLSVMSLTITSANGSEMCHYNNYQWNTISRKAVNHHRVSKPRAQLTTAEIDPLTGCSVCEEDQIELRIANLKPFKVYKLLAPKIETALRELQQQNATLLDIITYRVGKTRGDIDTNGNRTQFSNHSYGTALDINTAQNGLYENCVDFNAQCRLIKGGPWHPTQFGSLTIDSTIVRAFKQQGFKWGGEITGQQKDFMHFSLTGY